MKSHSRVLVALACCLIPNSHLILRAGEQSIISTQARDLTLSEALEKVLASNPELQAASLEVQAVSAAMLQAGFRPNPELSADIQNLPALSAHDPFQSTEGEFRISQRLETGKKRALRVNILGKEKEVATQDLERLKAEWIAITKKAFSDVLVDQQRMDNFRDLLRIAQRSHSAVTDRVIAGKVSPVEQTRSLISLSAAQLEEERQVKELAASKSRLASLWGGTASDFDQVRASFEIPPAIALPDACLESGPEMKMAEAAVEYRRASLAHEKAMRWPDITVAAGFRRSNLDRVNAWVAGVSLPIPLFDNRSAAIAEARIRLEKAYLEKKATERMLHSGLAQNRHNYDTAVNESAALANTALPAAAEVLAAMEEGYRLGKFDYLRVLDAQKTYAELKRKHIEAIAAGIMAIIEIQRIGGSECRNTSKKEVFDEN